MNELSKIEELQKQLEEYKKSNTYDKYIYANHENVLIISDSNKEYFKINNLGEFFINNNKINIDEEFVKLFAVVIEDLLGEKHGEMLKRIRREARKDILDDLKSLNIDSNELNNFIEKWK
jgi:hypothetical protein